MTRCKFFLVIGLFTITNSTGWAYGSSSSSKSCDKPKFSEFMPAESSETSTGSEFSFTASKNTYPATIKVTVKDDPITIKVVKNPDSSFLVSGKLPTTIEGNFARISIVADAQSNCKGTGGWLLKVTQ